jgi:hypothetical protein
MATIQQLRIYEIFEKNKMANRTSGRAPKSKNDAFFKHRAAAITTTEIQRYVV